MSVLGADGSNNNGSSFISVIRDRAVKFIYAKATEGIAFTDSFYDLFRSTAHEVAKPFGAYLFLHPSGGREQAIKFLQVAHPRVGDLQPVVDAEVGAPAQAAQAALEALLVLEAHGYDPLLYSYGSFLAAMVRAQPSLKRFRVWQAEYGSILHRIPGLRTIMWQFTDRMVVGKGRLHVDGDKLLIRSLAAIRIVAHPIHPPAPKKPTQPAPQLVSEHGKGQGAAAKKTTAKKTIAKKTSSTARKSATRKKPS